MLSHSVASVTYQISVSGKHHNIMDVFAIIRETADDFENFLIRKISIDERLITKLKLNSAAKFEIAYYEPYLQHMLKIEVSYMF